MNTQKFFMAASVAALAAVTVAAPIQASSVHSFTDVSDRHDEAVSFLYEIGVINGFSDTRFGTNQSLTRGDAAVILANMLGLDVDTRYSAGFTDVNERVAGAVNALAEMDIVAGVTKTQFKPNDPLSRGAMAKMLVLAYGLEGYEEETPFTDAGGVFLPYIEALYGTGITNGTSDTSYGTHANITRGDFSNLLYNTFMFIIDQEYMYGLESAEVLSPTSLQLTLTEAVPEEYSALETADFFFYSLIFEDGTEAWLRLVTAKLSEDRMTLTLTFENTDLTDKSGIIRVTDYETIVEAPFDFQ